jgi:hypothetical protein
MMNLNKLPEYFAIKRDSDNPLWKKYINWLNKTYNLSLQGTNNIFPYYGWGGDYEMAKCFHCSISNFKNPVTELTLEQWDNIVNKKDDFVLPEKWVIKVTNQNRTLLNNYRTIIMNFSKIPLPSDYSYMVNCGGGNDNTYGFTEITFEQFKKYVLKQDNMKEIIGYKLVKPEYKEAILQIMKARNWSNFPMLDSYESSGSIKTLKEAGVLDLWFEPVYAEEKKLPKINGFEARWENNQIIYGSNCAKFIPKFFIDLIKINDEHKVLGGNRTIKSIKLDSGVEITIEQIKQIQEYVESKN